MKRIILLMLPVVTLAVGVPEGATRQPCEEMIGLLWQASLTARCVNSSPRKDGLREERRYRA